MSLRTFFEKDVLIRLNETGFVETVQLFGLPAKCLAYQAVESESRDNTNDASLIFVRRSARRHEDRRHVDGSND